MITWARLISLVSEGVYLFNVIVIEVAWLVDYFRSPYGKINLAHLILTYLQHGDGSHIDKGFQQGEEANDDEYGEDTNQKRPFLVGNVMKYIPHNGFDEHPEALVLELLSPVGILKPCLVNE